MRGGRSALLVLLVLLVGGAVLRRALGLEFDAESVERALARVGLWGPFLFVVLVGLRFLTLIPNLILLPAGGILFGVVGGALYGALGLTLGGVIKYTIVAWAGPQSLLAGVPRGAMRLVDLGRSEVGVGVVAVASGFPVGPGGLVQIGAAIAGMSLLTFVAAVGAGSLVRASLFAALGSAMVEGGALLVLSLVLLGATALPLAHPRVRRWLREHSRPAE